MFNSMFHGVHLAPFSVTIATFILLCAGGLLWLLLRPSRRLNLPTFYVTSDVVATLEEAYKEVAVSIVAIGGDLLINSSAQSVHFLCLYREWTWWYSLRPRSKQSRHFPSPTCLSSRLKRIRGEMVSY